MRRPSLPKLPGRGSKPPLSPQAAAQKPPRKLPGRGSKPPLSPQAASQKPARMLPALKLPALKRPAPKRILLAAAALLVVVLLVLLIGPCGSDDDKDVRETLDSFAQASREKDYQALCDDLLSSSLVEKLRTVDRPCEVVFRIALSEVQNPTLEVQDVTIDGDEATAQVDSVAAGQPPLKTRVRLVQEDGEWRISTLPDEQQPASSTP